MSTTGRAAARLSVIHAGNSVRQPCQGRPLRSGRPVHADKASNDRDRYQQAGGADIRREPRKGVSGRYVVGLSGLGKSWLACALGNKACRENISVLYMRMPRLFADLAIAHGDARFARLLRSFARVKLLILDDWGPEALTSKAKQEIY